MEKFNGINELANVLATCFFEYKTGTLVIKAVFLPSAMKLRQGNIFKNSVHGGGGGVMPQCMLGYIRPHLGRHPLFPG